MKVIKRNGSEVQFDRAKIEMAIAKANQSVEPDQRMTERDIVVAALAVEEKCAALDRECSVEEIQDMVEEKLMSRHPWVARAYVRYRYLRSMARDQYKTMMDAVAEKLTAKNVQNQNANVDEASFGGRIGEAADVVTKQYALEYLVSPMARANHENNEVYIHDLSAYAVGNHNCLSIPFDNLLAKGFNTRQTDVRPAQSINTAFQLVAVIFQVQSLQQFGGVSATHLDWTMVPYVRKSFYKHFRDGIKYVVGLEPEKSDTLTHLSTESSITDEWYQEIFPEAYEYAMDMTERETKQAVEGMYHNLKYLGAVNGNVTVDLA